MIESAPLKARLRDALAGCFAISTAAPHGPALLTGNRELLDASDPPRAVQDLRTPGRR